MSWGTPDERFMHMAVEAAAEGIAAGQAPFGACLVRRGEVVGLAHNRVWARTDATAHAEIEAIRQACRRLGSIKLTGCEIYSTCEPCPMCFAAIHWAGIGRIVCGARIADAGRAGFSEIEIPNGEMKRLGGLSIEIVEDFLRGECLALFERWQGAKGKPY
jgi:guanine deaminase